MGFGRSCLEFVLVGVLFVLLCCARVLVSWGKGVEGRPARSADEEGTKPAMRSDRCPQPRGRMGQAG